MRHDEPHDLTELSTKEILELAQGKSAVEFHVNVRKFLRAVLTGNFENAAGAVLIMSACGIALFVDPLFLYIPLINEDKKCFMLDPKMKIIALVLRSFVDIPLALINMGSLFFSFFRGRRLDPCGIRGLHLRYSPIKSSYVTLATFPIPQIAILVFFPQMRGSRYLISTKVLNSLIMLQYVLRAWPAYYYCKYINEEKHDSKQLRWIPGLLNLALYIFASHIFGALWYFFSILREINCWISACQKEIGCDFSTFHCDSSHSTTFKNITRVNDLCPINPSNPMVFDFGIFLGPIQSGLVGSTNIPQKLLQGFSWGLRNLSSFASNLNPSNSTWEILFVILVSISGLLLFIYLIGHLQTFMQAGSGTYRIRLKLRVLSPAIKFMVSDYGLPNSNNYKQAIYKLVAKRLKEDEDLVVENIFSILPGRFQKLLKRYLFLPTLKKVPGLVNTDENVLTAIMEHLEPVNYAGDTYIIREGKPLDKMIFVTQGSVLTYGTSTTAGGKSRSSSIIRLEKGDFYGEELVTWAATSAPFSDLPISTKTVMSHHKVEVFAINAEHLQMIFWMYFNGEFSQPTDGTRVVDIHDVNLQNSPLF